MPRQSREFWESLVAAYERSGRTQTAFSEERGVSVATLRSWIYRLRRDRQAGPSILPVRVVASAAPLARGPGDNGADVIEAVLPSGVRLWIRVGADPGYVAELIGRLG